jgi:hypothetical protein
MLLLQQKNTDEADKEFSADEKIAPTKFANTIIWRRCWRIAGRIIPGAREAIQATPEGDSRGTCRSADSVLRSITN